MSKGWIKIHRDLFNHWLSDDKPYDHLTAWIYLIQRANFKKRKVPFGDEIKTIPKGSFITSQSKLMDQFGWSKSKLRRFLSLLESDGMISIKTDRKKTTLTICNYETYQDTETIKEPIADRSQTDSRPIADTDNKDKESKEGKYAHDIDDWEPPEKQLVINYCENHGIPKDSAEYYYDFRMSNYFMKETKNGRMVPIRNWQHDINAANRNGWIHQPKKDTNGLTEEELTL